MENKIINIMAFAAGAAIGSIVTCKLLKTKYEQKAQEEIDSVKEAFLRDIENEGEDEPNPETTQEETNNIQEEKKTYQDVLESLGYAAKEEGDEIMENKPYVISPDDFGMCEGYDAVSLTYYSNGILVDENGEVMSEFDIESQIGQDSLTHFGEYEEDSVFVRNEERETDYEILKREDDYQPESEEYDD